MRLSVVLVVLAAAVAHGHVIAVYQGMNLPIRAAPSPSSDSPQTTTGPCGGVDTFGANGVTSMEVGRTITLQLKYAQNHRSPQNVFMAVMKCSNDPNTLGDENQYRLSNPANQIYQIQAAGTIPIPDESTYSLSFMLPTTTPDGTSVKDGTYCTLVIEDQRDWGGCIDIKATSNPGPIIAGVVTPVVTIGAAAALFMMRRKVHESLLPESGAANPDRKMWQTVQLSFVIMVMAIISCSVPAWTHAPSMQAGPWSTCPSAGSCVSTTSMGFQSAAVISVRFFVITAVISTIFAFFLPIAVFYNRLEGLLAAKLQTGFLAYAGVADFIAFMVWVCIFVVNATPGWCLYINILTFSLCLAGAFLSWSWKNHCERAANQDATMTQVALSTPVSSPTVTTATSPASTVPKSYPSSSPSAASSSPASTVPKSYPGSGPKPYATNAETLSPRSAALPKVAVTAAVVVPPPPAKTYPKKWGDWEEIWDEENQAWYFFNHSNGESAWERPSGWPSN